MQSSTNSTSTEPDSTMRIWSSFIYPLLALKGSCLASVASDLAFASQPTPTRCPESSPSEPLSTP